MDISYLAILLMAIYVSLNVLLLRTILSWQCHEIQLRTGLPKGGVNLQDPPPLQKCLTLSPVLALNSLAHFYQHIEDLSLSECTFT